MDAFCILKNSLVSVPVMAFPRADRQYARITDAATGMADTAGGLGAILTQKMSSITFMPFHMPLANTKTTKKIIHHSSLNLQLPYGEWTLLMNI
jgi:hypothetical protein